MRIFYYNIDYVCNNNCLFCISHSVDKVPREMQVEHILSLLRENHPAPEDYIIINGGEPTLHSHFYELINQLHEVPSIVKIYSNGVKIDTTKINNI